MKIQVIGPGCHKCNTLAQLTAQAVAELGITAEITKVSDLKQIMALGVMMTPALAVDGTIKLSGKLPTLAEVKALLQ
ncbi:MAG: thioredoxin family protein [Akkermansiaceae bacterium]|nr:thioredoxin family protein [Akkermansiaceae bacterium]MCF7730041.1 thioredoxin family protein [Akkermansiaceae bacterium]